MKASRVYVEKISMYHSLPIEGKTLPQMANDFNNKVEFIFNIKNESVTVAYKDVCRYSKILHCNKNRNDIEIVCPTCGETYHNKKFRNLNGNLLPTCVYCRRKEQDV